MSQTCYLAIVLMMVTSLGCAMCDSSLDDQYSAYGGVRDRTDRINGRVASLFDPAASLDAVAAVNQPLEAEAETDSDVKDESSSNGGVGSTLTEDLLKELEKMEPLPELPADDST